MCVVLGAEAHLAVEVSGSLLLRSGHGWKAPLWGGDLMSGVRFGRCKIVWGNWTLCWWPLRFCDLGSYTLLPHNSGILCCVTLGTLTYGVNLLCWKHISPLPGSRVGAPIANSSQGGMSPLLHPPGLDDRKPLAFMTSNGLPTLPSSAFTPLLS